MERARKGWVRGALVLGVAGAMMAVAMLSPAVGASFATKKFVKQKVKAVSNRVSGLEGTVANLNQLQYMASPAVTVPDGALGQAEAVCPAGWFVTGGGGVSTSQEGEQLDSYPSHGVGFPSPSFFAPLGRTAWTFEWFDFSDGADNQILAFAICSQVAGAGGNYTPGVSRDVTRAIG